MVQTFQPDNPILQAVVTHDYDGFAAHDLAGRRALSLAPFARLVLIGTDGVDEGPVRRYMEEAARWWRERTGEAGSLRVLGPTPAAIRQVAGRYRWQLLLAGHRPALHAALGAFRQAPVAVRLPRGLRLKIDVDPLRVA
jgi:primosomal protein N' (replication factor Y)